MAQTLVGYSLGIKVYMDGLVMAEAGELSRGYPTGMRVGSDVAEEGFGLEKAQMEVSNGSRQGESTAHVATSVAEWSRETREYCIHKIGRPSTAANGVHP